MYNVLQGVFFSLGLPLNFTSTEKLIWARLGVYRMIYVNVDSPNLGFTYFNFLGEVKCNNTSRTDVAPWCYKWMGWVGGLISGRGEA